MEAEEEAKYLEERAEKLRKLELDKSEKLRKIKLYFQSKILPGSCDKCDKIFRQTWDLSKKLHDRIFGPKILHTKSA